MKRCNLLMSCLSLIIVAGCSEGTPPDAASTTKGNSAIVVDGTKFLITEEPTGAKDVIAVRASAVDGDDVVVVGRIGGGENPWVDGRAAFTIVDNSLKACSDIPGDSCEKPWDYCCETDKLPTSTALVKIVDENGDPVQADARELLHVTELSRVIVKGKAQRDDAGNLTVLATGLYLKK